MNVSLRAVEKYSRSVFEGTEPPLKNVRERVLRLAGEGSDVTEVSMRRSPTNILPIYEKPERYSSELVVECWTSVMLAYPSLEYDI